MTSGSTLHIQSHRPMVRAANEAVDNRSDVLLVLV